MVTGAGAGDKLHAGGRDRMRRGGRGRRARATAANVGNRGALAGRPLGGFLSAGQVVDAPVSPGGPGASGTGTGSDERNGVEMSCRPDVRLETKGRRGHLPRAFTEIHPLQIVVPPLREHPEDVPELAAHFARAYFDAPKGRGAVTFTAEAVALLQEHPWPGNVQELRQVIERILVFERKPVIDGAQVRAAFASVGYGDAQDVGPWSGRIRSLDDWEAEAIRQALLHTGGNKAEAARLLGIHRNTLALKVADTGTRR
jgi:transcriptional regulator with AAA-type ATPase domain